MDLKQASSSLESLMSSFTTRIAELQELVIARNMYAPTATADLSAIDATVKSMEFQMQAIKDRLKEETEAVPKANKLIELSLQQQRRLQHMLGYIPSRMIASAATAHANSSSSMQETLIDDLPERFSKLEEEPAPQKEKKGRSSAPCWYITPGELDSLSTYMRGRLTLDKVNSAINEIAACADANAQLLAAPRKKLSEDSLEKVLELRDISMSEVVKGKHFFLETDMKGSSLRLDNTGKAILTVLRHLGRIQETRIGHHRVITLSRPQ